MTSWKDISAAGSGIYLAPQCPVGQPQLRNGECVWQIDGRSCTTKDALFGEFARELAFPGYFGENWDAFDECISSLEWLPCRSHVIVIDHAECLLGLGEDATVLLNILRGSAKEWAEIYPDETFKVVLVGNHENEAALLNAMGIRGHHGE